MPRLSFHHKVLYVFCGLTLVPLIVLAVFAGQSLDTVLPFVIGIALSPSQLPI